MATQRTSPARAWFWATRPFSLTASMVPVLVGTAYAADKTGVSWLLFALALMGSVLIQIGTNLTDEYSDHRRPGRPVKYLAPHKVIERGLLSERAVLGGMVVSFALAAGMGLYIVWEVGWPILAVGVASMLVAYLYSSGPYPLGDMGLGEALVFVFMGPVMVMAAYYVQVEELSWGAFFVSMPVALLVMAILHCNNIRDIEEDREHGKRTLASLIGPVPGKRVYVGIIVAAYAAVVGLVAGGTVHVLVLATLITLPRAAAITRTLWRAQERPAMNVALVGSSSLHGLTGLAMAASLAVSNAL